MNYRDKATELMEQVNDEINSLVASPDKDRINGYLKKVGELKGGAIFSTMFIVNS
ncbi:hypothetical protein FD46_GL000779 [Liquorilactobacillus oeni DSM 19972]|uniref:Uncharacterized protein n=2 Tax=Liquorilactobacillus oeni TaxID=303241 RepID=A0A0R1MB77_9LACO|nr:hypothetical protein FD46_GL000779 [Liquorilactobacillus oeni DSM 19972]